MARTIYVNGRYADYHNALIHSEDRGFLFGDAVYEVCPVIGGRIVDEGPHIDRLERSLDELSMDMPMHRSSLSHVMSEVVRRNRVVEGYVYLEVSRGVAKRDFLFPSPDTPRTVVCLARHQPLAKGDAQADRGIGVVTMADIRWGRVDIKTVQLLAPVLAKEEARAHGAKEAWMVDRDGFVTEGASANAWIVTGDGEIVTRPAVAGILRGVTRTVLIELAAKEGLKIVERPFTVAEAQAARQAFVTSATTFVMPVTSIDGKPIGNGAPGELTLKLRAMVLDAARATAAA
jgi:D-alanine transaminase